MIWHEWAKSAEGYAMNLTDHPSIIAIAEKLSANISFMKWVGFQDPTIVGIEATCHIVAAALTRIKVFVGEFDTVPVKIDMPFDFADHLFRIPGFSKALWDAGWISSTAADHFVMRAPEGAFPTVKDSMVIGRHRMWAQQARKKAIAEELLAIDKLLGMNPLERKNDVPRD